MANRSPLIAVPLLLMSALLMMQTHGNTSATEYGLCLDKALDYQQICLDGAVGAAGVTSDDISNCSVVYQANQAECGTESEGWLFPKNPYIPHMEDWLKTHPQYALRKDVKV